MDKYAYLYLQGALELLHSQEKTCKGALCGLSTLSTLQNATHATGKGTTPKPHLLRCTRLEWVQVDATQPAACTTDTRG